MTDSQVVAGILDDLGFRYNSLAGIFALEGGWVSLTKTNASNILVIDHNQIANAEAIIRQWLEVKDV